MSGFSEVALQKKLAGVVGHCFLIHKGTVSRDFCFRFFFMNHLPPRPWKIYMLTVLPICVLTKQFKLFWLKFFSICHWCQRHLWNNMSCKYPRISEKIRNGPDGVLRGLGKVSMKKTWSRSWHCPFIYYTLIDRLPVTKSSLRVLIDMDGPLI